MMTKPSNVAILFSGRGSNMLALADALENKISAGKLVTIICNRPDAEGITIAKSRGYKVKVLDHKKFATREKFDKKLSQILNKAGVDFVCAAGFMRVLGKTFVEKWHNQIINIHPSLLPDFTGLNTHTRVLKEKREISGCSVHFISEGVDTGHVIAKAKVPVRADDTAATLGARVLAKEHKLYAFTLNLLLNGEVKYGDKVVYLPEPYTPRPPVDDRADTRQPHFSQQSLLA